MSQLSNWTADRLPGLGGRTFVVTGGNSGVGREAARVLAARGARVVLACRDQAKARQAAGEINKTATGPAVECVVVDLADLASVRAAAAAIRARYLRIDALVNNAGIMTCPERRTSEGYEWQLASNHLGHFLLSALLFDLVEASAGRIVTTSSIAHKSGRIDFDDLMATRKYDPIKAYYQSKLANLLFAMELDRRLRAAGSAAMSVACHPGVSATNLQRTGPRGLLAVVFKLAMPLAQSAAAGALPTLLAAAGSEAEGGGYYGPQSMAEWRGSVGTARVARVARDAAVAQRLWAVSEELVGCSFTPGR